MDYGLRISKNGSDVKTCADVDTIVNSKYACLKGALSDSGNFNNSGGTPSSPSVVTTEITHSLGYTPICQGKIYYTNYLGELKGFNLPCSQTPILGQQIDTWLEFDDNKLYIKQSAFGLTPTTTFYYNYFIFLDKGKL